MVLCKSHPPPPQRTLPRDFYDYTFFQLLGENRIKKDMGIRLPKYFTRTWQGLFSPDAAKIKDPAHAANGRPHRARAQSQSTEPAHGEQDEPRMNPEPPEPVPHPEPPAVVRPESEAQQVEIPEPPAEVQHPPEEVQHPVSWALVQPSPSEAEPSPEPLAVNGGPKRPAVVQETSKVRYPPQPTVPYFPNPHAARLPARRRPRPADRASPTGARGLGQSLVGVPPAVPAAASNPGAAEAQHHRAHRDDPAHRA